MTILIDTVLVLLGAVLLVPALTLLTQVMAALLPRARSDTAPPVARRGAAILIPAHNEETSIARTIEAIQAQLIAADRLVVVADNCSDDTAALARAAGVEVVERHDLTRTGKAYALDAGLRFIASSSPRDTIVFLDADCTMTSGSLDALVHACETTGGPVQSCYIMEIPEDDSTRARIAAFAWRIRNVVRPTGCHNLGLPCQLMGTGMAIPAALVDRIDFATGHVTEDLLIGVELARLGYPPSFVPEACTTSAFAPSERGRSVQRERWVHGHLAVIGSHAPKLAIRGIRQRDPAMVAAAADLSVPPLVLLLALSAGFGVTSLVWYALSGSMAPLWLTIIVTLALALAHGLAWWQAGTDLIRTRELAQLPGYIAQQIATAFRFLIGQRSAWIRSERN